VPVSGHDLHISRPQDRDRARDGAGLDVAYE